MKKRWMQGDSEKKIDVNVSAIRGEPGTGFEKAGSLGEFECGNCKFMKMKPHVGCYQDDMMERSKQPKNPDGSVKVDKEDCCEYVHRVGRRDRDEGSEDFMEKE